MSEYKNYTWYQVTDEAPASKTIAKVNLEDNGAKKVVVTTGDVTTVEVNGVNIVCKGNCEVVI